MLARDNSLALRQVRAAPSAAGCAPATAAGPGDSARLVETKHPALAVTWCCPTPKAFN